MDAKSAKEEGVGKRMKAIPLPFAAFAPVAVDFNGC
jgi:hypothetical protein